MKEIRRKGLRSLCMLFLLILLGINADITADAGVVEQKTSLVNTEGALNATDWFDPEDGLYIENGKVVMSKDSTSETRLISKILCKSDNAYKEMLVLSGNLRFTQLPQGEKFVFAMGLDSLESYSEEAGNVEIEFQNNGTLSVGMTTYNDNGEANTAVALKNVGKNINTTLKFIVTVTTDNKINVVINGIQICNVQVSEELEGRIGFLQSGNCGVELSDFQATFTNYDRPENTNISEDFETEVYNRNLFAFNYITGSRVPAYTQVEEYEDNHVMMFYNSKLGYFGTRHQYSNFELTFDVPYYLREGIKDEKGKTVAAPTQEFLVAFGEDALDVNGFGYATAVEAIRFTPTSVHGLNHKPEKFRAEYGNMGYFDPKSNDGFSVKISVVDGHMTLSLKKLGATKYDIIAEADYEDFRTGYIKFWSVNDGNFAIDNIKITNLDDQPNLIDVEFEGALITQEDYDYQPAQVEFRPETKAETKDTISPWLLLIGITAIGCAVMLGLSVFAIKKSKKKNNVKEEA